MKETFFKVVPPETVLCLVDRFDPVSKETITLVQAHNRVLAEDIVATGSLPGFARSAMDGYAVRAAATFGASEANPAYLETKGTVAMGESPDFALGPGEAAAIPTGGMMPEGTDSVVIIEHTRMVDDRLLEIFKPVAPGQNVMAADEDYKKGEIALNRGSRIRSQEAGLLAALGITNVTVFRKPKIGVISTGDEVVPADMDPSPARIRDVNTHTLSALVETAGGRAISYGIVNDHLEHLTEKTATALAECDMVVLSGGSSLGTRDYTLELIDKLPESELLVSGIAIRPGKPTILARVAGKPFWGLPGQVTSAMIVFSVIVRPFINRLAGRRSDNTVTDRTISALAGRNIPSAHGRVDYVRVRLAEEQGDIRAFPVFGKSGLLRSMVEADGLIAIGADTEGIDAGTPVTVLCF